VACCWECNMGKSDYDHFEYEADSSKSEDTKDKAPMDQDKS